MEEEVAKLIPCLVLSCLRYSDTHYYFEDQLWKLQWSEMFGSIGDSVMHFYIAYETEYDRIIEKVFEDPQFMKSKRRFFSKIGIRCLRMCDDPTFFNFLMMCAFVGRVSSFCYSNGKCYRVAENACKCAIAVFKRKFLELFQEGGFYSLWTYSDSLNKTVLDLQYQYDDLKDILSPDLEDKQRVLSLLNACRDVDSTEYILTDFENQLLYKATETRLRKLKPGLDCLMRRIPRKYFQMHRNQDRQNAIPNMFYLNVVDIASIRREGCSLQDYHSLLLPCATSSIKESYSSPIDYTLKKDSEPSNNYNIERQSTPSNRFINEKQSETSKRCIIEKQSEPPNRCIIEKQSEPSKRCISEKQSETSKRCIIEKQYEASTCCIIEKVIEPLNYCIAKRDSGLNNTETIPERSPSSVHHRMNSNELQSTNSETETANIEPKFATRASRMLKRVHSFESMNSGLSKLEDQTESVETLQIEFSLERDAVSIAKNRKIYNPPQEKLLLVTDCGSSQKQPVASNNYSPQKPICLSMRCSSFEDKLSNTERSSFEMGAVPSNKSFYKPLIPSDEDNSIQKYPFKSTNSNFQSQPCTEEKPPLVGKDSLLNCPGNITQEQSLSTFHQGNPLTTAQSKVAPGSYISTHYDRKQNRVSICPLSSESSSSSSIQRSSEGYFTGESLISDVSQTNEEFQSGLSPFQASFLTSSDSSLTENEERSGDWTGDTTLENLINYKCLHCGTKCFNYVMHVLQQFVSHFLD